MIEFISQPWPWYVAGPLIALVMFLFWYFGKSFGISSNLRTICSIGGAGKLSDFFDFDWHGQIWNLTFLAGAVIGGFIAHTFLTIDQGVQISEGVVNELRSLGIEEPGKAYIPGDLFSWENLFSVQGMLMLVGGGFLVGFGSRYAGGCTSGHAITGLSELQMPSLIAVVGFFIGGLIMTHLILPWILPL